MSDLDGTMPDGERTSSVHRVDADAKTWRVELERAARELGDLHAILTGGGTATVVRDHSGNGKGCLIGAPLCQPAAPFLASYDAAGEAFMNLVPVYTPKGEGTFRVEFDAERIFGGARLRVLAMSDFSVVEELPFEEEDRGRYAAYVAPDAGTEYALAIHTESQQPTTFAPPRAIFERKRPAGLPAMPIKSTSALDVEVNTEALSGATVHALRLLDDLVAADDRAYMSGALNELARMVHAIDEALFGRPAMGDSAYKLADSGADNPTMSAYFAATRTRWPNEPLFDFPIHAQGFGAVPVDGGAGEGLGKMTADYFCPGLDDTALHDVEDFPCYLPDFPVANGDKVLRCRVIGFSSDASLFGAGTTVQGTFQSVGSSTFSTNSTTWARPSGEFATQMLELSSWNPDEFQRLLFQLQANPISKNDGSSFRIAGINFFFGDV